MSEQHYIARLQKVWVELQTLVDRLHRNGPGALSAEELARLDKLYRVTTIHLSQARSRTTNEAFIQNLNHLVSRAHSVIYVSPKRHPLRTVISFYATGFARAVVRTARFHLVALALLLAGALAGYWACIREPLVPYLLMGEMDGRVPGATVEQLTEYLRSGREGGFGEKLLFASFLLTHNTKVAFLAFVAGALAGIPTVYLMLYNGAMLGAFAHVHHSRDIAAEMYAWLLPHGITELSAVVLAGGAGFMLGMAVIRPGLRSRRDAMVLAGKEAINLVLGVAPMFILAGFVESFVRQSDWTTPARFLFAAATVLIWTVYFLNGWRCERAARREAERKAAAGAGQVTASL